LKKLFIIILLFFYSISFSQEYEEWNREFSGRTIRNILIKTYNVGESIYPDESDSLWIKRLANSLHYKTRDWVIKENLIFNEGDKINFNDLYESERLLRETNLFVEVKINILPVPGSITEADIEVITKDKWSLTYLAKYDFDNGSGYAGLKDLNFIGLGHRTDAVVTYNDDPSISWGGRFRYFVPNIKGSFINAGLRIDANKKYSLKSFNVTRPFITYTNEWIGGIELKWERNVFNLKDTTNVFVQRSFSRQNQDLWAGKVFQLDLENGLFKRNTSLITSVRVFTQNFSERPYSPFQYRVFENSTTFLFGAGIISRSFYKDRFVEDFGITEDIPVGGSLSISTGPEERELGSRWYLGFETSYTDWIEDYGYLSGRIGAGSFFKDSPEQNTFNLNLLYHSYLYRWDIWTYRLFARYDLLLGSNRLSGENTFLYSGAGLRGIERNFPSGDKRMVLNLEARIFSPYELLGFLIGGIAFTDFGLITGDNKSFFRSRLYQSYGAGLRIKNESIINAAFQLVMIFNPYHPQNKGAGFSVAFSTNFAIGIRNIEFSRPFIESF